MSGLVPYVYRIGTPVVIDGDTVKVDLDMGFHIWNKVSVRLAGINAPEHNTPEGVVSRSALIAWIPTKPAVGWLARTYKNGEDKYGRYLAEILAPDGISMNQWLVDSGYAKVWDGTGVKPV